MLRMQFAEALHERTMHVLGTSFPHLAQCSPDVAPVDEISRVRDGRLHMPELRVRDATKSVRGMRVHRRQRGSCENIPCKNHQVKG